MKPKQQGESSANINWNTRLTPSLSDDNSYKEWACLARMIGYIDVRIEEPPKKIQNIMLITNNMLILSRQLLPKKEQC